MRKNTVLLFSKVPEVGLVKTRLSILKDGMFPPETTADLYRCMLFDVVEIIGTALRDLEVEQTLSPGEDEPEEYEFVISTTPAENVPVMEKLLADAGPWPHDIVFIADEGANFDEHYNHAFAQCWERGADRILSMGADMPALTVNDIRYGFEQLHRLDSVPGGGIVLSPDQEMGVSVIGWTRDTDFNHTGVFYNVDGLTVLPAYIAKAKAAGLPALWLPPIPDVDTMQDFFHNVTLVHALNYCAEYEPSCPPWRTAEALIDLGFREIRVAPNNLLDPRDHIDK